MVGLYVRFPPCFIVSPDFTLPICNEDGISPSSLGIVSVVLVVQTDMEEMVVVVVDVEEEKMVVVVVDVEEEEDVVVVVVVDVEEEEEEEDRGLRRYNTVWSGELIFTGLFCV